MNYRSIYKKHKGDIPEGYHIHHKDGNNKNNDISNLIAMSPFNHWIQHYIQGDKVALKGKFIQKAGSFTGEKNAMYGKNAEDYMTEEAIKEKRRKQSIAQSGPNPNKRVPRPGAGNPNGNPGKRSQELKDKMSFNKRIISGFRKMIDEIFETELVKKRALKPKATCIVCDKQLSKRSCKRCISCSNKENRRSKSLVAG